MHFLHFRRRVLRAAGFPVPLPLGWLFRTPLVREDGDVHPTVAGQELIANLVLQALKYSPHFLVRYREEHW